MIEINIVNINIERAIVHEIVHASQIETHPPIFSDELVVIDPHGQRLVEKRLVSTMASGSHCVDMTAHNAGPGSPFVRITSMLDEEDSHFVTTSQDLARKLSSSQTSGSIKAGTAFFFQGTLVADGACARFLAVIKADPGEGLYMRREDERITLTHVGNMLLSDSQRLLKVALFIEDTFVEVQNENRSPRNPDEFSIKVFDHLLQNSSDRGAAVYFYQSFLECRLADNASTQTKKFYEVTQDYIARSSIEPDKKIELMSSLVAFLRSNVEIIEPQTFARSTLPEAIQDGFINKCTESGLTNAISKNTTLLKERMRRRSLKFDSKVTIYAPQDIFVEAVRIETSDEVGWTRVKIRGSITS